VWFSFAKASLEEYKEFFAVHLSEMGMDSTLGLLKWFEDIVPKINVSNEKEPAVEAPPADEKSEPAVETPAPAEEAPPADEKSEAVEETSAPAEEAPPVDEKSEAVEETSAPAEEAPPADE
jgi:hypothetical protein